MKKRVWIMLMLVSLVLLGCTAPHEMRIAREARVTCTQQCMQTFNACASRCTDDCVSCKKLSDKQASSDYRRYIMQRCVQGKTRILQLQSYRDPLQCLKKSCDCTADFRTCADACSGHIQKRLQREVQCCD